jgi:hypothetical protein
MVFIDVSSCTHIVSADVQRHGVALLQIKTTGNEFGNKKKEKKRPDKPLEPASSGAHQLDC